MAAVLIAHYEVADPVRFVDEFDGFAVDRRRAGAETCGLLAGEDDPGTYVAVIAFPTREAAAAFARSPARAAALERATVIDRTDEILDVARPFATPG